MHDRTRPPVNGESHTGSLCHVLVKSICRPVFPLRAININAALRTLPRE